MNKNLELLFKSNIQKVLFLYKKKGDLAMATMKAVVLTACFLGIAVSIADTLKPGERFGKQIRLIFAVLFIIGITAPFLKDGIPELSDIDSVEASAVYMDIQEAVDDQLKESIESNIGSSLGALLAEKEITADKITVSINIEDGKSISINKVTLRCGNIAAAEAVIKAALGTEVTVVERME